MSKKQKEFVKGFRKYTHHPEAEQEFLNVPKDKPKPKKAKTKAKKKVYKGKIQR